MQRRVFLRGLLPATQCGSTLRGFATSKSAAKPPPEKESKTRAISGYAVFLKEVSGKLRRTGLPVSEISRQAAKEWAGLATDRRQKFIDEAKRLNASSPPKVTKKSAAPASEPKKKTGQMNAYSAFCKVVYPAVVRDNPGATFAERGRIMGEMWRGLSIEEKTRRKEAWMTAAGGKGNEK